jgi:hypothetical protein
VCPPGPGGRRGRRRPQCRRRQLPRRAERPADGYGRRRRRGRLRRVSS